MSVKFLNVLAWFDSHRHGEKLDHSEKTNWLRCFPFILIHLSLLFIFFLDIPMTLAGVVLCITCYLIRMFAITGFYHRYFSHKTFQTSKIIETLFAILGTFSGQRGPIWWAAHHRGHHQHSDTTQDEHSPIKHSFWHSHVLWFMNNKNFHIRWKYVGDLRKKPHLMFIDKFAMLFTLLYLALLAGLGYLFEHFTSIQLTPVSTMYWGFSVSTVLVLHATFSINSLAHLFGKRVYQTSDSSKNNGLLALITLGEGWHNNHHHWPASCKQGFHRKEIDITYYVLLLMRALKLISHIKNIPESKIAKVQDYATTQSLR